MMFMSSKDVRFAVGGRVFGPSPVLDLYFYSSAEVKMTADIVFPFSAAEITVVHQ
jgi:hypothetical protein